MDIALKAARVALVAITVPILPRYEKQLIISYLRQGPSGPRYITKIVGCHVKEIPTWTANLRSLRHLPLASKKKWLRALL